MGAIQPWHLIVLAVVVVALFGYNKLPDVTRSVGRSLRIFKTEMKGLSEDDRVRDEAQAQGSATVAPSVAPVPVAPAVAPAPVTAPVEPVAAVSADPTPEQIAAAQAVLAAAAQARVTTPSGNGTSPDAHEFPVGDSATSAR